MIQELDGTTNPQKLLKIVNFRSGLILRIGKNSVISFLENILNIYSSSRWYIDKLNQSRNLESVTTRAFPTSRSEVTRSEARSAITQNLENSRLKKNKKLPRLVQR
jgi:hypothetical protein